MFSKINIMKLIRSQNKLRQIAIIRGQKSVFCLLETPSQITWKISREVKHNKHISFPFLKLMFLEK